MCKKWHMKTLTDRDATAKSFEKVFSDTKRQDFPIIAEPLLSPIDPDSYNDDPINDLQKSILIGASYLARNNKAAATVDVDHSKVHEFTKVGEALQYLDKIKVLID